MAGKAQFPLEQSAGGEFTRQDDAFRGWVTADGRSGYPAAAGRYHLYVSWACPWAHRTIIVRQLKHLEPVIGMTVVDPIRDERGWAFTTVRGIPTIPLTDFIFLARPMRQPILPIAGVSRCRCSGIPSPSVSSPTPTTT